MNIFLDTSAIVAWFNKRDKYHEPAQRILKDIRNPHKFIYSIRKLPRFDVKLGKLGRKTYNCRKCNYENTEYEQKRVDILMAVDIVRVSWQKSVNNIIIIAGDSDFIPAVSNAKEAGLITKLYYSKYSIHDELLIECDDTYEIDNKLINDSLLIRPKKPKKK